MPLRLRHVIVLATLTITAVLPVAPAFADQWWGSASCVTHTHRDPTAGMGGYKNDEAHTWTIPIPQPGPRIGTYKANWSVTGNGGDDGHSWVTNGGSQDPGVGQASLQFLVSPADGKLHILRTSSGLTDQQGIMVTPTGGGNASHTAVGEILFPAIPPDPDPNSISVIGSYQSHIRQIQHLEASI